MMYLSYLISCLFTGILSLILGVLVFLKNKKSKVNRICTILNFNVAIWCWSIFFKELVLDSNIGLLMVRVIFAAAIFIPPTFFHFINTLIEREDKNKIIVFYFLSLIFLILDFTPLLIEGVRPILFFKHYGIPGTIFPFFFVYFISTIGYAHFILIRFFKHTQGQTRNQIKYLLLATIIGFFGGGTTFFPNFSLEIFPFGLYLVSAYVLIVSYSIIKHRLMDINIVLKKGTTYIILLVLLFVPSFILTLICQRLFFEKIDYLFSLIIFLLLFLVSILFHRIKPGTEKTVEQLLFKDKYDYRETLADFSKAMVSILDLNSLSKRIIDTITQTMGVEKASIFLFIEEKGGFEILYSKNVKIDSGGLLLSKNDPLPHYLQNMGEIIIREELAKGVNISELEEVVNQMATLEAQVSIPLIFKEQLIGIINLGYKFNKEIYSYEDIELLTTLANQAAIAIENAKLYEDLKKSKSYIRRADRLASLGTLTAGLAHEIRNPLVAIKTFTQLLPERLEDEEFRDRFLRIASGEVDRIAMLINELLDFARPSDPKFEPEDVNNILDGMILLISTEAKKKNIKITKNFDPNLPPINIDREQMKQVFLNILINAIEATPDNGEVTVKSRSFTKPNGERYIQIEFKDTGHGIPKEYLEEIFNPFFTTKTTGSGLGLSISNQIVQEHKGYIHVESQINKGSSFFVNLPLNQEHPKRRKTDFEDNSVTKDFDFFERR